MKPDETNQFVKLHACLYLPLSNDLDDFSLASSTITNLWVISDHNMSSNTGTENTVHWWSTDTRQLMQRDDSLDPDDPSCWPVIHKAENRQERLCGSLVTQQLVGRPSNQRAKWTQLHPVPTLLTHYLMRRDRYSNCSRNKVLDVPKLKYKFVYLLLTTSTKLHCRRPLQCLAIHAHTLALVTYGLTFGIWPTGSWFWVFSKTRMLCIWRLAAASTSVIGRRLLRTWPCINKQAFSLDSTVSQSIDNCVFVCIYVATTRRVMQTFK